MSTKIAIITRTADHREHAEAADGSKGYRTVPGVMTVRMIPNADMMDGLLAAQEDLGQVNWTTITPTLARGSAYNIGHGGHDRVVVIDTENSDGADIIDAMTWANDAK